MRCLIVKGLPALFVIARPEFRTADRLGQDLGNRRSEHKLHPACPLPDLLPGVLPT
jgi:hypothetical protein